MNIIISDVDTIIVDLSELPELVNLLVVNKYFNKLVSKKPIIKQWIKMKDMNKLPKNIFLASCNRNFLLHGYSKIDIHADNELAFRWSCQNGHKEMAQWLIQLGESNGYSKIDIHADNELAFKLSCESGHKEMAQWLIQLGGSNGNSKINKLMIKQCLKKLK